jgi:uncharacterized membrane protein YeaQ/YmgE (transglycosylase-associated protein family)
MEIKTLIYSALFTTVLFCSVSLVFYFGDWFRLGFSLFSGIFVGILLAPELEPKKFKYGWLVQITAGAIAGVFVGLFFKLEVESIPYCSIIGGFVGWTAPGWLKHFPIA